MTGHILGVDLSAGVPRGVSEGDETGCRRIHWKPFALILLGEDLYLREGIGCHERVQI